MKFKNWLAIIVCFWSVALFAANPKSYGEYQTIQLSQGFGDRAVVLVNWDTLEGIKRLERSDYREPFFRLANYYQPQMNPLYCGIATSVMILNAMRIPTGQAPSQSALEIIEPIKNTKIPFPAYSQLTFLNAQTDKVKKREIIDLKNIAEIKKKGEVALNPGLTLAELKAMLETYQIKADLKYAAADPDTDKTAVKLFREDIKSVLRDPQRFLIVNIDGQALGANTKGHISPIAAYDEKTDSVLVLDVAVHKNPWYWAPVTYLYHAMHTKDGEQYRGYLIVSDAKK